MDIEIQKFKEAIKSKRAELSISDFNKFLIGEMKKLKMEIDISQPSERFSSREKILGKYVDEDIGFVMEISGYINSSDPTGALIRLDESTTIPLYNNVDRILKKHNRSNQEAIELLVVNRGTFPLEFVKRCVKPLIAYLQSKNDRERDKIKMSVAKSYLKPFPDYLLHEGRELLAGEIKNEFKTECGKGIRLLIEALIASNPTLLTIENRKRKAIYNALKEYLNRDIGTYQSIFDYKYNPEKHKKDFDSINTRLQFIIENLTR